MKNKRFMRIMHSLQAFVSSILRINFNSFGQNDVLSGVSDKFLVAFR